MIRIHSPNVSSYIIHREELKPQFIDKRPVFGTLHALCNRNTASRLGTNKYVLIMLLAHDRGLVCTALLYCSVCWLVWFASVKVRRLYQVKILKLNSKGMMIFNVILAFDLPKKSYTVV